MVFLDQIVSILPPSGEGARRADECFLASPISENLTGDKSLIRPLGTFSQGEKDENKIRISVYDSPELRRGDNHCLGVITIKTLVQ